MLLACGDDRDTLAEQGPDAAATPADGGDAGVLPGAAAGNENRPEGVAHCYTPMSNQHDATRAFWVTFRGGHLEGRARVIDGLADAAEAYPKEEEFALLNGLANLWRVAEPLPSETDDQAGTVQAALAARTELERAYDLCPSDHRIPAWLGPVLVNTGRAIGDESVVADGLVVLQKGVDHYPAFVSFSVLLVHAELDRNDPDFRAALDAVRTSIDACEPGDPACTNHPHAAHNVEGASVFFGDALAKGGDRRAALEAYALAEEAEEYREWNYQSLLTERLDELDARVDAFGTSSTEDDPESAWQSTYQCSICHQQ